MGPRSFPPLGPGEFRAFVNFSSSPRLAGDWRAPGSCAGAQRVHVGIWHIHRAQRGSHIPTLRPKYVPYTYIDPLGRGGICFKLVGPENLETSWFLTAEDEAGEYSFRRRTRFKLKTSTPIQAGDWRQGCGGALVLSLTPILIRILVSCAPLELIIQTTQGLRKPQILPSLPSPCSALLNWGFVQGYR